ncbi:hypothetical protein Sjap_019411 [Stephania japonica]|uniref:Thionin-like protein 2 n=1 Tax=Stephania japonica TaxID=461633 RepID=A0AAP0F1J6_9MAGN
MEGLRGSRVAVQAITLVVILLSSSSCVKCRTYLSRECLQSCYNSCPFIEYCSASCIAQCWGTGTSSASLAKDDRDTTLHHYCELGCAYSLCSTISTINNPNVEAVEGCVKSCSDKICIKYPHH